ncbi:MAG: hypothetical protein KGL39_14165 [Patescibacteria group bacterium]|nr:hypothetical protein [Patescibacteria group bacterium]
MSNILLTISEITNKALFVLENNLKAAKQVNRQYDDRFGQAGAKIGTTLNIRKPIRPIAAQGPALNSQNFVETEVPITLDQNPNIGLTFSSVELRLSLDMFSDRVLAPAVANLANKVDFDVLGNYINVYNAVGTPGTVPSTSDTYLSARQKLNEEAAPDDAQYRATLISPAMEGAAIKAFGTLFNPQSDIAKQYRTGTLGVVYGSKWSMDQNVNIHTFGIATGSPEVATTSTSGDTTLATKGWTASQTGIVKKGDVFTVAAVNAVNPQNYQSTGSLRMFVVTADANSDASGNATISVSPSITSSGQFQTVDALPQANAVITPLGSSSKQSAQGLLFHRDAIVLASADLELPGGVDKAARVADDQVGLSLLMVRQYDINTGNYPTRVELLYGTATIRPEFAVRICS